MATYTFHNDIHFYNGSWGTLAFGSANGSPIGSLTPSSASYRWRTILGVTITPETGEKVTSLTLNIGLKKPSSTSTTNVSLGGYLYDSLDTAKSVTNTVPSRYVGHYVEPDTTYTTASGRMAALTWTDLDITAETTLYIWLYVSPGAYYEIWTSESNNVVEPSVAFVAEKRGLIYIENGSSFDAYYVYIDNGLSWDLHMPFADNSSSWDLLT